MINNCMTLKREYFKHLNRPVYILRDGNSTWNYYTLAAVFEMMNILVNNR